MMQGAGAPGATYASRLGADSNDAASLVNLRPGWKIMVVDDDPAAHDLIAMTLEKVEYDDRPLEFIHFEDPSAASEYLRENDDVAIALIDIVMNDRPDGLKFAKWIRSDLHNQFMRLIIITSHGAQMPERDIVAEYDINHFLDKRYLAGERLVGAIVTALRSFTELTALFDNRKPLAEVIHASGQLYGQSSLTDLLAQIVDHLRNLGGKALNLSSDEITVGFVQPGGSPFRVVSGDELLDPDDLNTGLARQELFDRVAAARQNEYSSTHACIWAETANGRELVCYITANSNLRPLWNALELYWENACLALSQPDLEDDL